MVGEAPVDERFSLRVRNLPAVLSPEAITSLLSHYGAIRVRVLQRRNAALSGKEPGATTSKRLQKAVAIFGTRETQQNAQKRLHSLELAGHHLQVEVVGDEAATTSIETQPKSVETQNIMPLNGQPPLPKGLPPPLPPMPPPVQNPLYAPAPLAPHLGLNYAPSPLLEYKYPKATESIVRNIANALIALPRFYTQVLHLMNKMNLPPPFDEDAIPGRFTANRDAARQGFEAVGFRRQLKRRKIDEKPNEQIVEEEEDDEEDTMEVGSKQDALKSVDHGKTHGSNEATLLPSRPPVERASSTTDMRVDDSRSDISTELDDNSSRPVLLAMPFSRQSRASAVKKSAAQNTAFQLGVDTKITSMTRQSTRPGVISENEVKRQRLAREDLQKEPLMATYLRGAPSTTIMVKNIVQTVDEMDLRYVFGYVLPLDTPLTSLKITLQPGQNSAEITYPDKALAAAAVDELLGLQLEGKPLIVSFQDASGAGVQCWTIEKLASKRLPESELALEKAAKKYQRGSPSDTLYVKNLVNTVELTDLFAVFGAVLPSDIGPDKLNIRHFTTGRMKCQAFVKYPTVELASSALDQVHGVVLKDKPMIVCFRKPQTN